MTDVAKPLDPQRSVRAALTLKLVSLQVGLLFLLATSLLLVCLGFKYYYEPYTFTNIASQMGDVDLKIFQVPTLVLLIYAYVIGNGLLFAVSPSERSFNLFFTSMIAILAVANADHFVLDWFVGLFGARFPQKNAVGFFQILASVPFFLFLTMMHYNILSDDLQRRLLRRGVPTSEIAHIRRYMYRVLVPVVFVAGAFASGLALVGEFSAFLFQQNALFSNLELIFLAALIIPIAFLVRSILRDLAGTRGKESKPGPNR